MKTGKKHRAKICKQIMGLRSWDSPVCSNVPTRLSEPPRYLKLLQVPEYNGSQKPCRPKSVCGNKTRTKDVAVSDKVGYGSLMGWHPSLVDPRH